MGDHLFSDRGSLIFFRGSPIFFRGSLIFFRGVTYFFQGVTVFFRGVTVFSQGGHLFSDSFWDSEFYLSRGDQLFSLGGSPIIGGVVISIYPVSDLLSF